MSTSSGSSSKRSAWRIQSSHQLSTGKDSRVCSNNSATCGVGGIWGVWVSGKFDLERGDGVLEAVAGEGLAFELGFDGGVEGAEDGGVGGLGGQGAGIDLDVEEELLGGGHAAAHGELHVGCVGVRQGGGEGEAGGGLDGCGVFGVVAVAIGQVKIGHIGHELDGVVAAVECGVGRGVGEGVVVGAGGDGLGDISSQVVRVVIRDSARRF